MQRKKGRKEFTKMVDSGKWELGPVFSSFHFPIISKLSKLNTNDVIANYKTKLKKKKKHT